jgi:hypothetical protein
MASILGKVDTSSGQLTLKIKMVFILGKVDTSSGELTPD